MGYPKVYRIPVPSFLEVRGKHYLSVDEVKELLSGIVVMEEKVDGKIDAVVVVGNTVYFEYMKFVHTVVYTKLPSFQLPFDVWDGNCFLDYNEKKMFLNSHGFFMVRKIFYGRTNYDELLKYLPKLLSMKSGYGEQQIEGVVIKNYKKQLFGKIVNPQFEEEIGDVHWSKKPIKQNRLSR